MERVTQYVPMAPPAGLVEWPRVQDDLDLHGLIYDKIWVTDQSFGALLDDRARGRKVPAVRVRCSYCGKEELMPWAQNLQRRSSYGFLQDNGEPCFSGDTTLCPCCGVPVRVKKAADLGRCGSYEADQTFVMSADVVGPGNYLVLSGWKVERRVSRQLEESYAVRAEEAYVFSARECARLQGWLPAYSGTAGYYTQYKHEWGGQPAKWSETWGETEEIYNLTPELIARSCLPHCKLDVYMSTFSELRGKYPVPYLRLCQAHPAVENLIMSGLPLVLDDLMQEQMPNAKWRDNVRGVMELPEIDWSEARPAQMLHLTREELRLGRDQGWQAYHWRLFVGAKQHGELLTADDFLRLHYLGDKGFLALVGWGPISKSIRYLEHQPEIAGPGPEDDWGDPTGEIPDAELLRDYWALCEECGRDLADPHIRWPMDLFYAHDAALELQRQRKARGMVTNFRRRRRELARYIFEHDGLRIVPAGSQADLDEEAEKLNHCVWTYGEMHATGKTAIFFIRRSAMPREPYYTLELDERELRVRQNRGRNNCARTEAVQAFEDLWISWVRDGARRDKDGKPVLPTDGKEEIAV